MSVSSISGSSAFYYPVTRHERSDSDDSSARPPPNQETSEAEQQNRPGARQELSDDERQQVKELAARDREVKAHEMAHKAAGGGIAGPVSYEFTTGPDGKRYASGGEVSIDTSKVPGDPQATLLKANRIRAAALAPAEPSGQDRKVAAQAARMAAEARMEVAQQTRQNDNEETNSSEAARFDRQPLYDNSGSVSGSNSAGDVVDEMV